MKEFDSNATKLVVSFVDQSVNEEVVWEIDEIPEANLLMDDASDSENSTEVEFTPFEDGDTYRAILYVNMYEGNIEIFNDDTDEEIKDFKIEEFFDDDKDK